MTPRHSPEGVLPGVWQEDAGQCRFSLMFQSANLHYPVAVSQEFLATVKQQIKVDITGLLPLLKTESLYLWAV